MEINRRWAEAAQQDSLSLPRYVNALLLIKALSQADEKAEFKYGERSARIAKPQVTLSLLRLLMQHMSMSSYGMLTMIDMCTAYWILAHRVRFAHLEAYNDAAYSSYDGTLVGRIRKKYSVGLTAD